MFSTVSSVFGYPDETLFFVFDILREGWGKNWKGSLHLDTLDFLPSVLILEVFAALSTQGKGMPSKGYEEPFPHSGRAQIGARAKTDEAICDYVKKSSSYGSACYVGKKKVVKFSC